MQWQCARCRKRKIRCSGDPGDGSGCQNCKQAGVDPDICQFYRVGTVWRSSMHISILTNINQVNSTDVSMVHSAITLGSLGSGGQHSPMPLYGGPLYSRSLSAAQYPGQLDTKAAMYPPRWTIPCPEETSPIETYNLDQSTAYVPNTNTLTSVYGQSYGYQQRALQQKPYLDHSSSASYTAHGLPCVNTSAMRTAPTTEPTSPLNMTSIQSMLPATLPERPRPRQVKVDGTVPRRQLPMPQPSPAQSSRNTVDLMQDQRLRSGQILGGSAANYHGAFAKPSPSWTVEDSVSDIPSASSTEASATDLMAHTTASVPTTTMPESALGYIAVSPSGNATTTSAPQLNFSTSLLFDAMPAPATTSPYSHFRSQPLPTSSAPESRSMTRKQASHADLYSFSPDRSSKKSSLGSPLNEAALVSGQRYDPLTQSQPQHTTGIESARRDASASRSVALHRPSTLTTNHNF
jgi:hypothetical protein